MLAASTQRAKGRKSMTTNALERIADNADALTDPRQHTEPRYTWDHNRNRKPAKPHRTTIPSLIQQLRDLAREISPNPDSGTRTIPDSTPPGQFSAVDLLATIAYGAARWAHDTNTKPRPTEEETIRALVGTASNLDSDTRHQLAADLSNWRRQAETITQWRTPAMTVPAPCPINTCGRNGTLLAHTGTTGDQAWCSACGASWDHNTIGILARHVVAHREASDAARTAARTKAIAERREQEEHRRHTGV